MIKCKEFMQDILFTLKGTWISLFSEVDHKRKLFCVIWVVETKKCVVGKNVCW